MDLLEKGIKNISLYEVKKQVRKAQNVVLNYSEMEAKVREATNNEPWGTSSKKMQEIADGTYNYRDREEIVGMIFRRFTEKTASEWRQIYKALILLEYIIKHGSEKFVDDARANMSLISMLKNFHYTDSQGRDQGINIRNRAKLLLALLNDDLKIRSERKKARENAKKFGGVSGGASLNGRGGGGASSFDSTPGFGGAANMIYGDGGVYGARFEEPRNESSTADDFEEYDAGGSTSTPAGNAAQRRAQRRAQRKNTPAPAVSEDLFSFDDDDITNTAPTSTTTKAPATTLTTPADDDDDDFDDFQSAAPVTQPTTTTPIPDVSNSLFDLIGSGTNTTTTATPTNLNFSTITTPATTAPVTTTANYNFNSFPTSTPAITTASKAPPANDAFSSLFSSAKTSTTIASKPKTTTTTSNNTDDLFGDFTANTNSNNHNNTTTQKPSNDLDLLSF